MKISCVPIVRKNLQNIYSYFTLGKKLKISCVLTVKKSYIQSRIFTLGIMLKIPMSTLSERFYIQYREEIGRVVVMSREVKNPEIYSVRW